MNFEKYPCANTSALNRYLEKEEQREIEHTQEYTNLIYGFNEEVSELVKTAVEDGIQKEDVKKSFAEVLKEVRFGV